MKKLFFLPLFLLLSFAVQSQNRCWINYTNYTDTAYDMEVTLFNMSTAQIFVETMHVQADVSKLGKELSLPSGMYAVVAKKLSYAVWEVGSTDAIINLYQPSIILVTVHNTPARTIAISN